MKAHPFRHFANCADDAPARTYDAAKDLRQLIGDTVDQYMAALRESGFDAHGDDRAWALECALYDFVRACNPDNTTLVVAESFGLHMETSARAKVLENTTRDRDALDVLLAQQRSGTSLEEIKSLLERAK